MIILIIRFIVIMISIIGIGIITVIVRSISTIITIRIVIITITPAAYEQDSTIVMHRQMSWCQLSRRSRRRQDVKSESMS